MRANFMLWVGATLALAGCAHVQTFEGPGGPVTLVGLAPSETERVVETYRALEGLTPTKLRIPEAQYLAHSRFQQRFGFPLQGGLLVAWLRGRVTRIERGRAWTVAVHGGDTTVVVTDAFFTRSLVERMSVLLHEARHSEGDGHDHVECPEDDPVLLRGREACDGRADGAYAYQAALLYEMYAYGLVDPEAAHRLYRDMHARILPLRTPPVPGSAVTSPNEG